MTSAPTPKIVHGSKSIKDQYGKYLWLIIAANTVFLLGIAKANAIRLDGLRSLFANAESLLPLGFAVVVTTVLNGLLSADTKARFVFLRWNHALPGHRAFTVYAKRDPRVDIAALVALNGSELPADPVEQNRLWYKFYRSMEGDLAVDQSHKDFLLLRDYTGLSLLFVLFYGAAGIISIPSIRVSLSYVVLLIVQFAIVRHAASNYGIRFVTTVLARRAG